jgi:hypothetical protein
MQLLRSANLKGITTTTTAAHDSFLKSHRHTEFSILLIAAVLIYHRLHAMSYEQF